MRLILAIKVVFLSHFHSLIYSLNFLLNSIDFGVNKKPFSLVKQLTIFFLGDIIGTVDFLVNTRRIMPKTEEQLCRLKESRRLEIVNAALKVFCKKGYDGTTINDIVKKAKCSHGLFYHYFESKKEIFAAVMENRGKNMMDFLDEVIDGGDGYAEKLYKLTAYTFDNMKKDEVFAYRYYFFVSMVFAKTESGEKPPKCDKKPPHQRMFDFFKEGIDSGDFRNDYTPDECAKLYNSIIQGATLNFILCPKEFKSSFKFPPLNFIVDVFKKENQHG